MTEDEKFRQRRRITSFWNFMLGFLEDIKFDHDSMVERLGQSLGDMEVFAEEKGIPIELCHLANNANFIDELRFKAWRKKILDRGNDLIRELESERID